VIINALPAASMPLQLPSSPDCAILQISAPGLRSGKRTMPRWAAGLNLVTPSSIWSGLDDLLARRTAPITELRGFLEGRKLGWWWSVVSL
jgi:hypothetical protein